MKRFLFASIVASLLVLALTSCSMGKIADAMFEAIQEEYENAQTITEYEDEVVEEYREQENITNQLDEAIEKVPYAYYIKALCQIVLMRKNK